MAIKRSDIRIYGSATNSSLNPFFTPTNIGGAIDLTAKPMFVEFEPGAVDVQTVSSEDDDNFAGFNGTEGDIYTREAPGGEHILWTGKTPNPTTISQARTLWLATTTNFNTGDCAIESINGAFTGTLAAGTDDDVTLPAGASAVDQFYRGWVIRETNGAKRIRTVIDYNGTTKVALVSRAWGGTAPGATTTIRVSKGVVFDQSPSKIVTIYRPNTSAPTGTTVYEKIFVKNTHATDSLTTAQIAEVVGGSAGHVEFTLETTKNGSGKNGVGNDWTVAPSSGVGTFDSSTKSVPTGTLAAGDRIGVWLKNTPATEDNEYVLETQGDGPIAAALGLPTEGLGASTFNYTASGGIVMGGSAGHSTLHSYSGSGGIVMGGAAITSFAPSTAHNYNGSGGVVTGGAARTYRVPNYKGSGGIVLGDAADIEATLVQISFDILNAFDAGLPVYFDILSTIEAPNGITAEFDIYEGANGVTASFDIYSGRLRTARVSEDVQMPVAEWILN